MAADAKRDIGIKQDVGGNKNSEASDPYQLTFHCADNLEQVKH